MADDSAHGGKAPSMSKASPPASDVAVPRFNVPVDSENK